MARLAVMGMGAMGSRVARRLLGAGHEVVVWNRRPERAAPLEAAGARVAGSPREAASEVEAAIAFLTDVEAAEAVWCDPARGALAGLPAGGLAVASSTLTPSAMRRLGAAAAARGRRLIEAPVVGSTPQADAGTLVVLRGGTEGLPDRATAWMGAYGARVVDCGALGSATAVKLGVNATLAVQVALLAEVRRLWRREGVDRAAAAATLAGLPVASPLIGPLAATMDADVHAAGFPVALVEKDLRYALEAAGGGSTLEGARRAFARAVEVGHGGLHLTAVDRAVGR